MDAAQNKLLSYDPLERLHVRRPVDRVSFIAEQCRDKSVLDVGCFDETALAKRDTDQYLHGRISSAAREVIGIDSSTAIPPNGMRTGPNSVIFRGDGVNPNVPNDVDIVVAGEFIEHIECPLEFFRNLRQLYPGKQMIISTPNGTSVANTLLGVAKREAQHQDHLQIFSFKILNTLCSRAGFPNWDVTPYYFRASETMLNSRGAKRTAAAVVQRVVNAVERLFPLLACGYIVRATL